MPAEECHRAAAVKGVNGSSEPRAHALETGELLNLFGACDAFTAQGARDTAALASLVGAGMRRSEVVGLDLADYDAASGELKVRHSKGTRMRTVYATNGAKDALAAWLDVRGDRAGPLLLAVGKGDEPRGG
jgi:site-specific recombinase XerC